MNREQTISFLATNCDCWQGAENTLKSFSDQQLAKLKANADKNAVLETTANALLEVAKKSGAPSEMTVNAMPAFIKEKIEEKEEEEEKPAKNKKATKNADPDDEEEDDDEEMMMENKKKPAANAKPITERLAPDELEVWNSAVEITHQAKRQLIERLTANAVDDNARKAAAAVYGKMKLPELKALAATVPQKVTQNKREDDSPFGLYIGAGGTPPVTDNAEADAEDVKAMTPPTINYAELATFNRKTA